MPSVSNIRVNSGNGQVSFVSPSTSNSTITTGAAPNSVTSPASVATITQSTALLNALNISNNDSAAILAALTSSPVVTPLAGTTGVDYSANQPTIPNVGANFANSGVYSGFSLLVTVPASETRNNIDVENVSGSQIVVIRDDGSAPNGNAPVNASMFSLAGGSAPGAQGGSWSSTTFKGRIQVYAANSASYVSVFVD